MASSVGYVEDGCGDGKASQENILWPLPFTVSRRVRILALGPPTSRSFEGHQTLPVGVWVAGQGQDTQGVRLSCRESPRWVSHRDRGLGSAKEELVVALRRVPGGAHGAQTLFAGEAVLLFAVSNGGGAFPRGEFDLGEVICVVTERPRGARALTRSKDSWNRGLEILGGSRPEGGAWEC